MPTPNEPNEPTPLQRLIMEYLQEHPEESYSSIARRGGIGRATVHLVATKGGERGPRPATIAGLAKGLGLPLQQVSDAAQPERQPQSQPSTPLQRLIAEYLRTHKGENYSSIARRGSGGPGGEFPRSTVQALATRNYTRQTPQPDTIRRLARGLEMPEERVREAAGQSAGYEAGPAAHENPEIQLLITTVRDLDPERLEAVLRRAELLHKEMLAEQQAAKKKRRKT